MGLGSLLGAAAGLLIPGGGALTAAIGSGIGSLIEGDDPRDAIRNAVIAGVGAKVFPNAAQALQNSGFGRAVTRGIGSMGIGTQDGLAALRNTTAVARSPVPVPRPSNLGQAAARAGGEGGIFGDMNLGQASGLLTLAGAFEPQPQYDTGPPEGFGQSLNLPLDTTNLYYSMYTGRAYDTPEERDAADQAYQDRLRNQGLSYGSEYEVGSSEYTQPTGLQYPSQLRPYREGGMIEGPGTVTSDSIPAKITQNGKPVEDILVSNGEVILSGKDLAGLDPDGDMGRAARKLDSVPNGSRGAMAAKMYADMMDMRKRA
jgi:hypothetical protein